MLTYSEVRKLYDYDYVTGLLLWNTRPERSNWWNEKFAGKPVGTKLKKNYLTMEIKGKEYFVHRIIWLWVHGEWPKQTVDHINFDKIDNRIENLRDVSASVNGMHQRNSRLGILECPPLKNGERRWSLSMKIDGQWGARRFKSYDEALAMRERLEYALLNGRPDGLTREEAGWHNSRLHIFLPCVSL